MTSSIPADLRGAIERRTGAAISAERPRGGGGASRQGAEISLQHPSGTHHACYLSWDERARDSGHLARFTRETAVLAALSGTLSESGVRVARLVDFDADHLALCSEFVDGCDRFPEALDKSALAADFMAQLALLHRIDPVNPVLAPLGNANQPIDAAIADRLSHLTAENLRCGADPLLQLVLNWLADNVPPYHGPAVVCHGDAGPGNFLYSGDKVTALVDWEFSHLGDPMEDLAQIWVRSLIQPFVPMDAALAAYEHAGGHRVDLARIRYHRLYFQVGFSVDGLARQAEAGMVGASNGVDMMFGTMHRRIMVESLAELTETALQPCELPDCPATSADAGFAVALVDLRAEIVPALTSQRASSKAKALARMVKYWRMRARYGAAFDAAEIAEIQEHTGAAYPNLSAARTALGHAIAGRRVLFEDALTLCHRRCVRETFLMADAMGALATTSYEKVSR